MSFFVNTMVCGFSLYQILAFFLIYSCLGWCLEVIYAAVSTGQLVNRGFLNGPVCPCLLYTSPSPRDPKTSRMPSSA